MPLLALGLCFSAGCASTGSSGPKTEQDLIADLASTNPDTVTRALQKLEKEYPTSKAGFPAMKGLLRDSRSGVRRKAARVLGILHADVNQEDVQAITAMFKASDPREVIDALKGLRGLDAPSAVLEILPLLQSSQPNIIRDSCRTLAVLGSKATIASIEPLLNHSEPAVRADAQDAIFKLNAKP